MTLSVCAAAAIIGCADLLEPRHGLGVGTAPTFEVGAASNERGCARFNVTLPPA
jgi:hypothetical protein